MKDYNNQNLKDIRESLGKIVVRVDTLIDLDVAPKVDQTMKLLHDSLKVCQSTLEELMNLQRHISSESKF